MLLKQSVLFIQSPLNLQDQKVSAMNSDLLNPRPIYFLNSPANIKTNSPFLCHELLDLGEGERGRG